MNPNLARAIESAIGSATGRSARIVSESAAGGGCINHASRIELEDGRTFFLKWNPSPLPRLFECEAEGLRALHEADAIRVPAPVCTSADAGERATPFIVMEYIQPGRKGPGFFEDFGRRFAQLHRRPAGERFGFAHDNYLGSTPQPNAWMDDWVEFWRERRLGFQLALARQNGLADSHLNRLGDALMDRLPELIGQPHEPPCLLHGDLWGGNYLADADGSPVLIDPAAYVGRREADLAMTMLFGGFDARFYSAYQEAWPLADDSDTRLDIYKLYHLLNHLNLFGSGYRDSCLTILRRYGG